MRVNIATSGRFHVLDLARELDNLGFDVCVYSLVSSKRARHFGYKGKNYCLLLVMLPFLLLQRLFPLCRDWTIKVQDFLTAAVMRRCDVFIAMSGNYVYSLRKAQERGAIVILERGSKHILEQREILEAIPSLKGTKPVPDGHVSREIAGYGIADYISVASSHVRDSFLKYQIPEKKIFVNPYGVDLEDFYPFEGVRSPRYDIIMVGTWCYQKGCDLLQEASSKLNLRLLHVGTIGDLPFPSSSLFRHYPPVDQKQLVNFYHQARISCLPSRQEGLAMVQMQAIASGLLIVCSPHTGGRDLGYLLGNGRRCVFEMEDMTCSSLVRQIQLALATSDTKCSMLDLTPMSWQAYGRRYADFLKKINE